MNSPHEDAVLNFDLDFLHPTTNNIPVQALKQRYIGQVKKRIIRVDALHSHCNSLKLELCNKSKELELTKKKLASTTQEYTQTSLDYKEALENYSKCEKECQSLQNKIKDFQDKYYEAVNNVEAGRSHIVQLQQLVKQHERKIELLQKNETNKSDKANKESLEKELSLCKKTYKKDLSDWQSKYNKLLQELQETKYSKEKLQKQLSVKKDKFNHEIDNDFISHDEHSENEDDISDDCPSGLSTQNMPQSKVNVMCPITNKDDIPTVIDTDFKNDVVSVDTGCGSSLASSLNSPDFVFSPINGESFEVNRRHKLVNTGTSPILLAKMIDTATSPPPAVKMVDVGTSPIKKKNKTYNNLGTQTEFTKSNNTSDRPIKVNKDITNKVDRGPIKILEPLPEIDMLEDTNNQELRIIENIPQTEIQETQEKHCLDLNNSNNMRDDCTTDNEVVMILNTMRLNKLITPIPRSPKKCAPEEVRHPVCPDAAIARDQAATAKHEAATAREDAAKIREENKKMMTTLASLMKDMFCIKRFLKNSFTEADATLKPNDSPLSHDLLKTLTNEDLNDEINNAPDNELNNSDFIENQTVPACASDSDIEKKLERILGIDTVAVKNTNVTQNENGVLPNTLAIENSTDNIVSSGEQNVMCLDNSVEEQCESSNKVPKKRERGKKIRKLTNLGLYRKKCERRKYKIRGKTPPLRKPCMKAKPVIRKGLKKVVKKSDTSVTLNDKDVYANAVKVMAELNAKSCKKSTEPSLCAKSEQIINSVKDQNVDIQCEENMLLDIKSPASSTISVTTTTKSTEHSASSPKSIALFPSPNISPSLAVTSPTDSTYSYLRRSRRSSVLAISCNSTPATKASTVAIASKIPPNMSAPLSPIPAITSPIPAITSPTPATTSPTPAITSPTLAIISPTPESKSPMNCITSPSSANSATVPTRRSLRSSSNSSIKSLEASTPAVSTITSKPLMPCVVITRSRNKSAQVNTDQCAIEPSKDTDIYKVPVEAMARKRKLSNSSDTQSKRVLRSAQRLNSEEHTASKDGIFNQPIDSLEVFAQEETSWNPKESILCVMIQKYAKTKVGPFTRNVPDAVIKSISNKIEKFMLKIKENPCVKDNDTMLELVEELQKYDYKNFVSGLIKYLTNPDRKMELFGKSSSPPAPQMTRYEAVMLFVIRQLRSHWSSIDIVDVILSSIEHTLFKLNRTPDFDVVESVSHFYALVCRYFGEHSRLKMFMLDSMYCILFKSVPLIKQCLEVHPHIIPLAHMSAAKTSLVTIFVYLLHFYKCDDQFNRVQDIRNLLARKYRYQVAEWNETKMLELVGNSIMELKDISNEQKMLRIAVIILGKRHGAKWTQNNIIKKLLQIIEKENTTPEHVTAFCVSLIGPLMKPYPADMKVHCEIALNKLVNIMNTTTSRRIEEAAISSLIMMGRHNYQRVNEILFSKKNKPMSPELEEIICDYIRMRPLNIWTKALPRISMPT